MSITFSQTRSSLLHFDICNKSLHALSTGRCLQRQDRNGKAMLRALFRRRHYLFITSSKSRVSIIFLN